MGAEFEIPLDTSPAPPVEGGFKLEHDLFKTVDGRVVKAGTGEAAMLYRRAGRRIPMEEAVSLGLVEGGVSEEAGGASVDASAPTTPHIPVTPELLEEFAGEWKGPFLIHLSDPTDDGVVDLTLKAVDSSEAEQKGDAEVKTSESMEEGNGSSSPPKDGAKKAAKPADKKAPAPKNKSGS